MPWLPPVRILLRLRQLRQERHGEGPQKRAHSSPHPYRGRTGRTLRGQLQALRESPVREGLHQRRTDDEERHDRDRSGKVRGVLHMHPVLSLRGHHAG